MGNIPVAVGCKSRKHHDTFQDVFCDYESIISECLDKIRLVDQSMTNLANSVDIMYAAVNGSEDYRKELTSQDSGEGPKGERCRHISQQLVHFLEFTVWPNKNEASTSVCDFLNFVLETVSQFIVKPTEKSLKLKLNNYQNTLPKHYSGEMEGSYRQDVCLKEDNKTLSAHISVLLEKENNHIEEIKTLAKKNEVIQSHFELLEAKTKEAEETVNHLKAEIESLYRKADQFHEKGQKIQLLESKIENLQIKLNQFSSESKDNALENEILNNSIKEKLERIGSLEGVIIAKKTEIERQQNEIRDLENKCISFEQQNARMKKESHSTVKETMSKRDEFLEKQNQCLEEKISRLNLELARLKRKKFIQVQLYYQRRGDLICKIEEELVSLLKKQIESENKYQVEFVKCLNASDIQTDKLLLLLCISASRIGTDAANTIQGIHLTSKMVLLIFHHKDEHALPSQASGQILTGKEYKTLGGIHDFAFLTGKGLYTCTMNDKSLANTIAFIKTEGDSLGR